MDNTRSDSVVAQRSPYILDRARGGITFIKNNDLRPGHTAEDFAINTNNRSGFIPGGSETIPASKIYGKVDIYAKINDYHTASDGSVSDPGNVPGGRMPPAYYGFKLFNNNDQKLAENTIDCTVNVPTNSAKWINLNINPDPNNLSAGGPTAIYALWLCNSPFRYSNPNGYINTRAKKGETWSSSNSATTIENALFPDDVYRIQVFADDIDSRELYKTQHACVSNYSITNDNFAPYMKKNAIYQHSDLNPFPIYEASWKWSDARSRPYYELQDLYYALYPAKINTSKNIKIEITFSEPMRTNSHPVLKLKSSAGNSPLASQQNVKWDSERKTYTVDQLPNFFTSANLDSQLALVISNSLDLAGNRLDPNPYTVALRTNDGTFVRYETNNLQYSVPLKNEFVNDLYFLEKTTKNFNVKTNVDYYFKNGVHYSASESGFIRSPRRNASTNDALFQRRVNVYMSLNHDVVSDGTHLMLEFHPTGCSPVRFPLDRSVNNSVYLSSLKVGKELLGSLRLNKIENDDDVYYTNSFSLIQLARACGNGEQPTAVNIANWISRMNTISSVRVVLEGANDREDYLPLKIKFFTNERNVTNLLLMARHSYEFNNNSSGEYFINTRWIHVIVPVESPVPPAFDSAEAKLGPDDSEKYYTATPRDEEGYQNGWKQIDETHWEWHGLVDLDAGVTDHWKTIANGNLALSFYVEDQTGYPLEKNEQVVYDTQSPTFEFMESLSKLTFNILEGNDLGQFSFKLWDNLSDKLKIHLAVKKNDGKDAIALDFYLQLKPTFQIIPISGNVSDFVAVGTNNGKPTILFKWTGQDTLGMLQTALKNPSIQVVVEDEAGNVFNSSDFKFDIKQLIPDPKELVQKVGDLIKDKAGKIVFIDSSVVPPWAWELVQARLSEEDVDFRVCQLRGGDKFDSLDDHNILI